MFISLRIDRVKPLSGCVFSDERTATPFNGWLELLTALSAALEGAVDDAAAPGLEQGSTR